MAQYGFPNNITGYHPWGNSRYNGLQLQLNKRYSANFSIIAAYTWSHAQDDSTATNFSTILSPRRAQDFQNLAAEWASSALDRRQRFTFTPVYEFRPFQNGNWLLKNVAGNWNLSGTYTYQSPEFATVQSGVDANLNGDSAGDRAIINPNGAANVGSAAWWHTTPPGNKSPWAARSIVAYVAINPTPVTSRPNPAHMPTAAATPSRWGISTTSMPRLMKKFNFTERYSSNSACRRSTSSTMPSSSAVIISDVNAFRYECHQPYIPGSRTARYSAHINHTSRAISPVSAGCPLPFLTGSAPHEKGLLSGSPFFIRRQPTKGLSFSPIPCTVPG